MSIKVIAFDADDTLWADEPYFRETEDLFCEMFQNFHPQHTVAIALLSTGIENLTCTDTHKRISCQTKKRSTTGD